MLIGSTCVRKWGRCIILEFVQRLLLEADVRLISITIILDEKGRCGARESRRAVDLQGASVAAL